MTKGVVLQAHDNSSFESEHGPSHMITSCRYDKAANLLIAARQFDDALRLCERERVPITDKMVRDQ